MPTLDYGAAFLESGVNNVKAHSWDDVLVPFQKVRTLLNTTGIDTTNIQANGIRPADLRANTGLVGVRVRVYNDTGSSITAGSLVYMKDSATVDGESFPKIVKAIATTSMSSTYFAQAIVEADIANNTAGTVSIFSQIGSVNTSAGAVGDPVYLNTSAGGWTLTRPTGGNLVQVVGVVIEDHASTGKINFFLASFPDKNPTDTLSELGDTNITSAADASMLLYDTGTSKWIDNVMSGDATMADTGAVTLAGTNTNLTSLANLVTVGTIGTGTWAATDVAVSHGGTGASSAGDARTNLGLAIGSNVQAYDAGLNSIAALTTAANKMIYTSGSDTYSVADLSSFARTILDDADAAAVRTTIGAQASGSYQASDAGLTSIAGLTTAANKMIYTSGSDTYAVADLSVFARTILDDADAAAVRTTIGAQASGSYQTSDAGLTSIAGLTTAANKMIYTSGSDTYAVADLSVFARTILDDADAAAVRTTIGAQASGTYTTLAYKTISVSGQDDVVADAADDTLTFAAGAGIALTTTAGSDTVTITNSATGANAFGTVAVSGQDNVVADSTGDTLTFAAGSNITLTTTAGSDTVTIAAGSSGHTIQEEGSGLTARANLNFVGAGVTATDDSGNDATKVTITPTGASLPFTNSNGGSDAIALTSAALGESLVSDTSPQLGGNLDVNGQSIVSDSGNENIPITPHGTGSVVISKADINGGAIDGTAIGAASASTGAFTTIGASGAVTVAANLSAYVVSLDSISSRTGAGVAVSLGTDADDDFAVAGTKFVVEGDNGTVSVNGSAHVLKSAGMYLVNDTANGDMTQGITVQQGANDNEILALKSSDIAHGMTDFAETDTYMLMKKNSGTAGAGNIVGFGEGGVGFKLTSYIGTTPDNSFGATAGAGIILRVEQKSGTGAGAVGANGNVFGIRANQGGTVRSVFLVDEDGDVGVDGSTTLAGYDDFPDWQLARAGRAILSPDLFPNAKALASAYKEELNTARIILHNEDTDGKPFLNLKRGLLFAWDGLYQVGQKIYEDVAPKVEQLESAMIARDIEIAELKKSLKLLQEAN